MKQIVVHVDAESELREAVDWYEERRLGLGGELRLQVQSVLDRIAADPDVGANLSGSTYRFCRVKQFPYVVYYREIGEIIFVPAIVHSRRRPNYWRRRKPE